MVHQVFICSFYTQVKQLTKPQLPIKKVQGCTKAVVDNIKVNTSDDFRLFYDTHLYTY